MTIALGAGANAAVSAVAYSVLLKPLPLAEPDRVVAVWPGRFMSQVDLRYLRDHARGLSSVAGIAPGWTFSLTGAGDPSKVTVDRVSGNLFETVGATPLLGRTIRGDEDTPGAAKVLVLSHRFWRARFGGDSSVVGRTIRLDDIPHEIVGVMPASFEILTRADAWAPLPADRAAFYDKLNFSLLVGRLAPGTPVDQADRDFKALMPSMRGDLNYPATFGRTARIQDLRAAMTGDMRSSLTVLAAAVGFMLLIAGANLGTLLVASGASRAREFAVRAAIGASRGSLVRLQLIEGLMLAAAGAVAGLALAMWGLPVLVRLLPRDTPRTGDIHVDGAVMLTVVGAALLVALLFAIVPSLTAGRTSGTPLREGASTESRVTRRARGLMVSVEIALALVLTIGAGLMVRTLWHLNQVDPGIDVERILTLRLLPTSSRYKAPEAIRSYYDHVLARIGAVPGVTAAGAIQHLPFSGIAWVNAFEVEGQPVAAGEARPTGGFKLVTGDYFRAVGQRLLAGRTFTQADRTAVNGPLVVNETFARRSFGGAAAAIGRRMRTGGTGGTWASIAGVVTDVRTQHSRRRRSEFYAVVTGTGIPALMLAVGPTAIRSPSPRRFATRCGRPQRSDRRSAADADDGGDDDGAAAPASHPACGVCGDGPGARRNRRLRCGRLRRDAAAPGDRHPHGARCESRRRDPVDAGRIGRLRGRGPGGRDGTRARVQPDDAGPPLRGTRDRRTDLYQSRAGRGFPRGAGQLRSSQARRVDQSG